MNRRYFTIIIIIALPILLTIYFFRGDQEEQPESEEISLSINRIHQKGKAQDNSPDNSAGQQLDYEIQAGVKVAGRLLHSDGNYFGGGKVLAVRAKGRRNLTIVTANARGRFRFKSLPPELIIFKVTSSTFPRPVELPVELQEGKDMDDLELVVPRGKASLKGVVVDPDNMPMSGVTIYLSSQNGYKVYEQSLVSDDHGNLFFQELWPGEYALSFEKKGYREYKLIRRTSKNSFRVVLTPLYQISGEVHDLNDKPSTYFTVKVIGRGEYNRSLSKNFRVKNGKFAVNVEAGRFDLLVKDNQNQGALVDHIELDRNNPTANLTINLGRGMIQGRLVNLENDKPVAGAVVKLKVRSNPHLREELMKMTISNRKGEFKLTPVFPGRWSISIVHGLYDSKIERGISVPARGSVIMGNIALQRRTKRR